MIAGQRVVVIAPCYNEEARIGEVVRRVREVPGELIDEILVVDDGSTDRTADTARETGARVLELGRSSGVGAALRAGFVMAREEGFDIAVVVAGNNKDEPGEIPRLLEPIATGEAAFVQGSRWLRRSHVGGMPLYRRLATRLHPILFGILAGRRVTESTNGFRAFRLALLDDRRIRLDQPWLDAYELEPYLYFKVIRLGYPTAEVPCTKIYPPRGEQYTKMRPIVSWWSIFRPVLLLGLRLRS